MTRTIFLETVAGVPGMVAGMLRHMSSLRSMQRDHGVEHCHLILAWRASYLSPCCCIQTECIHPQAGFTPCSKRQRMSECIFLHFFNFASQAAFSEPWCYLA
eukprot:scaffold680144_cov59-Prasinocladus_malaysianus.AAC.1